MAENAGAANNTSPTGPQYGPSGMVSIPLYMNVQGVFVESWSIGLEGKISRDEFSQIVAALNETCLEEGPGQGGGARTLRAIPLFGIPFKIRARGMYNNMNEALQAKCKELSEMPGRRAGSVNVRFVVAGVQGRRGPTSMTRIDIEVA
ncbi:hypothetical protein FOA52_014060 [Chlamydomonas sp. UWO 241]|nr:hypothetical protein FOA52_014060 [Chlamydomonas sp. UWO 241]